MMNEEDEGEGMSIDEARTWAAQCWCDEPNRKTVVDVNLAESFAKMLHARVNEEINSYRLRKARRTFREALENDEGLRISYVANIAMLLHDRYGIEAKEQRDRAAEDLLKLIFDCQFA